MILLSKNRMKEGGGSMRRDEKRIQKVGRKHITEEEAKIAVRLKYEGKNEEVELFSFMNRQWNILEHITHITYTYNSFLKCNE